jgi:ribonuclease BN (tRNA processing enzyme)
MAADIAMRLDAEKLVLTHYSQRYRPINSPEENTKVSI